MFEARRHQVTDLSTDKSYTATHRICLKLDKYFADRSYLGLASALGLVPNEK